MSGLPQHLISGPAGGTPLILGPAIGTTARLWAPQLRALTHRHRVCRFDLPGHGGTPSSVLTEPSLAGLADLVIELADHLGWDRFHYAGVSLGGAIGTQLAIQHPERLHSLALICTSARFGPPEPWLERAELVRVQGMAAIQEIAPARWFADPATADAPSGRPLIDDLLTVEPAGYAACCTALASCDLRPELRDVSAPTLVVAGRSDRSTPPQHARELADGIPGAALVELPGAGHLAGIEQPGELAAVLVRHLEGDRGAAGEQVRREVLGDAHVTRANDRATDFTADFQDFITRNAWGEIWTRPGLDRRTRSCITLTALVARGHLEELALHVRAALTNGLSRDEVAEVLLQTAVYCGVPAANSAFAVAQRVLDGLDESP